MGHPGEPTNRERQAEQRRNQLIDIALDLFAEKGVGGATIKDIATRAGVAQGLVYHYFDSKEDLLPAIIERHGPIQPMTELLASVSGRPAAEGLPLLAHGVYRIASERRKLLSVLAREILVRPEMRLLALGVRARLLAVAGAYLDSRIALGELRPHDTTVTLQTLAASVIPLAVVGLEPEPYITHLVETLLHGVAVSTNAASVAANTQTTDQQPTHPEGGPAEPPAAR